LGPQLETEVPKTKAYHHRTLTCLLPTMIWHSLEYQPVEAEHHTIQLLAAFQAAC